MCSTCIYLLPVVSSLQSAIHHFNASSSFEQTLYFMCTPASSRRKSCYMSCRVYVMWSRHMAVESKHRVDGNEHICEIYFVAYVILFLCSSLSPKYRKKLSVGCLNTLTVKWKTSSMLLPLLELTKHGRIEVRGATSELGRRSTWMQHQSCRVLRC